jgi:hypothetical protein
MSTEERVQLRKDAARLLFFFTYELRYRRPPQPWDWTLGWALISGALAVVQPSEMLPLPLSAVHGVAHDVRLALDLVEQSS